MHGHPGTQPTNILGPVEGLMGKGGVLQWGTPTHLVQTYAIAH